MLWQDFRKQKVGYLTLLQDWSPSSGLSNLCNPVENSSYADIMGQAAQGFPTFAVNLMYAQATVIAEQNEKKKKKRKP